MKHLLQKYGHIWVGLYGLIYMPWFAYLEKQVTSNYSLIQISLDKKIPFIEFFVVPYLLWFLFLTIIIAYFFFTNKTDFYRLSLFLIIGMTLFLIISTLYPNGQSLRPTTFARDNIFVELTKCVYNADTPTNVFPSIHVYNTLGAYIAVCHSKALQKLPWVQISCFVMSLLIILSTVFLKQHSVIDVVGASAIAVIAYCLIYAKDFKKSEVFLCNTQ